MFCFCTFLHCPKKYQKTLEDFEAILVLWHQTAAVAYRCMLFFSLSKKRTSAGITTIAEKSSVFGLRPMWFEVEGFHVNNNLPVVRT